MNKHSLSRHTILLGTLLLAIFMGLLWYFWQDLSSHPTQPSQKVSGVALPGSTVAAKSVITTTPGSAAAEPVQDTLPAISQEMATEIRRLSNHNADGLEQITHPDGSVSMEMQDRFQSVLVGVRDANGNIVMRHGEEFLQNVNTP